MRRTAFLAALILAGPASGQQAGNIPAVVQQPFGQPPPPPPPQPPRPTPEQQRQLDREHHRLSSWLYRGLVAAAIDIDETLEIDTPVTGYGNEALWDVPPLSPPTRTASAPPPPNVAAQRDPR